MKKILFTAVLFAVGICLYAQGLSWDIKFLKGRGQESVPISQIIRMETGEEFRFSILPNANAFCYIVYYGSQREVIVLHDQQLILNTEVSFGPFKLSEPSGTETIYVILSTERQANIESLARTLKLNPDSRQHGNNLYREVVNLQNSVSRLGEPASTYIPSGGTARSAANTQQHVTRFSGSNLYVRAITIRH